MLALLCAVGAACQQRSVTRDAYCGNGVCDGNEHFCPDIEGFCEVDCGWGFCDPCNFDGRCEPEAYESPANCPDCRFECDALSLSGATHDLLVAGLRLPQTEADAAWYGVDLDGDWVVDNHLGRLGPALAAQGVTLDLSTVLNAEIRQRDQLLVVRMTETDQAYDVVGLELLRGFLYPLDATPLFDGHDEVVRDGAPRESGLCAHWDGAVLQAMDSAIDVSPGPLQLGLLGVDLELVAVFTEHRPDGVLYGQSQALATQWSHVLVGGRLTTNAIYDGLFPTLRDLFQAEIDAGTENASPLLALFDGACEPQPYPSPCDADAAAQANCVTDGQVDLDELLCSSFLHGVLAPDIDSDGDGEPDLIGLGFEIELAVPVTVSELQ